MPSLTRSPTIVSSVTNTGTLAVANQSNVLAPDGAFATVVGDASVFAYSYSIITTGYDFSALPNGATLTSITWRAKRKASVNGIVVSLPYLHVGGAFWHILPSSFSTWTDVLTYESAAMVAALPTVAQVKAAGFGFSLQVSFDNGNGVVADLDHMELVIAYEIAAESDVSSLAWEALDMFLPGCEAGEVMAGGLEAGQVESVT